jgi:hypothetical protein
MNSDLPGGLGPDDLGPDGLGAEPGLEQLLMALTADGTAGELAGEQAALAMFRAHVPSRSAAGALTLTEPEVHPAADRRQRQGWLRTGRIPRLRIAAVSAAALVGGFAAAAYASALPAPVQHIAYDAFHYIGVPDNPGDRASGRQPGTPSTSRPGQHASTSAATGAPHPTPSGSGPHSSGPTKTSPGKPTTSTSPTSSPSPSTSPTGPAALSVSAGATQIPAGTPATISGQLTLGGTPDAGVYVRLMERGAGQVAWVRVARAKTDSHGDVSFTTPALAANARFRLAYATGTRSSAVPVTVTPGLSATLTRGAKGISDYVAVHATYARRGDVVQLQVLASGAWVTLKSGLLSASGRTAFKFSATKWAGDQVQVVLLATRRHGSASFSLGQAPAAAAGVALVSTPVRPQAGGQARPAKPRSL